jgi:hypothetical protein
MNKVLCLSLLGAVVLLGVPCGAATSSTALEREFHYAPARFHLTLNADGTTQLRMPGATRETEAGYPDLPRVGERIELPLGQRLVDVEVLEVVTAPLASGVRLPTAQLVRPGLGPLERSAPDPEVYGRAGFVPERLIQVGLQGFERGRNVAYVVVAPARWDPATGELERVERVRVRLLLGPTSERPLERLRVVPDWERPGAAGVSPIQPPAESAVMGPGRRPVQAFKPTQLPSLLGSPVAYVIITDDAMAPVFQQLADWKTESGVPAVVRTMSFIAQEYPFGSDDAERLRLFIRDAYTRWGTKWVLLGGDTDAVPTRLAYTTYYGGEYIATDLYYSCLEGNWNADGDSLYGEGYTSPQDAGDDADLLPETYVGRAPASTPAEAQVFVDKTLQYVRQPVSDYMANLLFFAEVLFPQDWTPGETTWLDGAELIDYDVLPVMDTVPWVHYARLYENYTDPRWRPGALLLTREIVIDSLNQGYNLAVHVGHGYRNSMRVGDDALINNDAMGLTNGNRQVNLYAINCTSNAIDFPCIGEAFMKNPNGGTVTNIGSTRFDFPSYGRLYQEEYFELLYQDSVTAIGEAQAEQKVPFLATAYRDDVHRWTQMTLLLLGDPELRMYTNTPRTLSVTHPPSLLVSDTTLTVNVAIGATPLYGARVTAYMAGAEWESGLTDGAGNATLPVWPDSMGRLILTVTGFDCQPYQDTILVVSSAAPALAKYPVRIDDTGAGGSSGNGNRVWDAWETVALYPVIRNNGGSGATGVMGTLSTTDTMVTVIQAAASYGTIAAGDTTGPATGFLVSIPAYAPDQREVPFTLRLVDDGGGAYLEHFQLTVSAPELHHFGHGVVDLGGNFDGRPDSGETVSYFVKLRNLGTGIAQSVSAKLRSVDGLSTVVDSTAAWGDIGPGLEVQGDALTFVPPSDTVELVLVVSDLHGERWQQTLDLQYPSPPVGLKGVGAASTISLQWARVTDEDLLGYNVYRSDAEGGPYTKQNIVPTERTAYYQDGGLLPLTRYYYKVMAVDSSGNESNLSDFQSASTNPPMHAIFPIPTGRNTPAPIAMEHLYYGYPMDIAAGADFLYVWHEDGSAPVDADGAGATSGDFTTEGSYYAAGPTLADIDGGEREVIGPTWDDMAVYVFDLNGDLKPGWPAQLADPIWSAVAVGDLLDNGQNALVMGSNGDKVYALRADGSEWMDGDSNPTTFGVFKVLGAPYNFGTPALAPLEDNGQLAIIFGSYDSWLYAWRADGTDVPGFPVLLDGPVSGSVAVGSLDGAGGPLSIVVGTQGDHLYVVSDSGEVRTGFPVWVKMSGTSKSPSPALADMNDDGFLDIVIASTNGAIYVWDRNGSPLAPWDKRYSTLTSSASECSPVVADIDGDGTPDIVMGDENGELAGISGADGTMLPGFPIQLLGEVRGTPAVGDCDGDTQTEIAVAGWDKNVYVWDYDFPFSPGEDPPWPQFHHDAARTGYVGTPVYVAVEDERESGPRSLELAAPAPNPARGGTRLWYAVPSDRAGGALELAIYDLSGRRVRLLEKGSARAGRHSAAWDLRDASGSPAKAGVYFARLSLDAETLTHKLVVVR